MSCLDCNQTAIPSNPVLTPPVYPPDPPNPPGGRCGGVTLDWECVLYRGTEELRFGVLPGESLLDAWQRLSDGGALTEQEIRDLVGTMFADSTTISFVYNPQTGKVSATYTGAVIGSEGVSDERIRDVIGAALEDTDSIDTVYDDPGDKIRFNVKDDYINALIDARTKTDEQLQDFIAAMFLGQAGVTYDDAAGKILLSFGGGGGGGTQYDFSTQFALTPDGSGGFAVAINNNTSVQRVEVSVDGTLIGTRKRLNLIAGNNVTINVTDDNAGDKLDVTIETTETGSGEVNNASNIGTGVGLFKQKTGANLEFKTIKIAGENLIIGDEPDEIILENTYVNTYADPLQLEQSAQDVSSEAAISVDEPVTVNPAGLFTWLKKVLSLPFKWTGLQSFDGGIRGDGFNGTGERLVFADAQGNLEASSIEYNQLVLSNLSGDVFYVSVDGDDLTGRRGDRNLPFATINAPTMNIQDQDTIHLLPGQHLSEAITTREFSFHLSLSPGATLTATGIIPDTGEPYAFFPGSCLSVKGGIIDVTLPIPPSFGRYWMIDSSNTTVFEVEELYTNLAFGPGAYVKARKIDARPDISIKRFFTNDSLFFVDVERFEVRNLAADNFNPFNLGLGLFTNIKYLNIVTTYDFDLGRQNQAIDLKIAYIKIFTQAVITLGVAATHIEIGEIIKDGLGFNLVTSSQNNIDDLGTVDIRIPRILGNLSCLISGANSASIDCAYCKDLTVETVTNQNVNSFERLQINIDTVDGNLFTSTAKRVILNSRRVNGKILMEHGNFTIQPTTLLVIRGNLEIRVQNPSTESAIDVKHNNSVQGDSSTLINLGNVTTNSNATIPFKHSSLAVGSDQDFINSAQHLTKGYYLSAGAAVLETGGLPTRGLFHNQPINI